ncbi:hypothetical protein KAI54_03420 [Candidatus Gracilibacteria bacterium]|nr:hypothetical protein [Candidatus Gracilibacteria bacterium]
MLNIQRNKPKKKSLKKEDYIGSLFGIGLVWSVGLGGIIPYIVGILFGIWLTNKMLNSKKSYFKIIFWVLFATIFITGTMTYGMREMQRFAPKERPYLNPHAEALFMEEVRRSISEAEPK